MGPEQPHRRRLAMTDPIFERLPSETLDEAAKALEWKPCIEGGAAYRSLGELPTSARIEWLDKNRERLEDAIRSAGSWTLGETRTYPAVIRGLAEKLDVTSPWRLLLSLSEGHRRWKRPSYTVARSSEHHRRQQSVAPLRQPGLRLLEAHRDIRSRRISRDGDG